MFQAHVARPAGEPDLSGTGTDLNKENCSHVADACNCVGICCSAKTVLMLVAMPRRIVQHLYLLVQLSRSQIVIYNSWLQTRVTHGRHETSPLRLQLLGNGDILSLETRRL